MNKLQRITKYVGVGVITTATDYLVYELCVLLIFQSANLAWLSAIIAGVISTTVGFILHNSITWKERDPGKYGVVKFFAWNGTVTALIKPGLVLFFGLFTGLYQWIFSWTSWVGWSYDFVESTGVFVLTCAITMILNFTIYERLIFGKNKRKEQAS